MPTFGTPTYAGSPVQTTSLTIARPTDLGNGDILIVALRSQDGSNVAPWSSTLGFTLITADPILTPENFAFLENTIGPRLTVFPVGGHCGNLRFRDNVAAMLDFFQK